MQPIRRFWRSLEGIIGCTTVSAQWRHFLGREYALTKRLLVPSGELATFYPHPDATCGVYRVISDGPTEHVAVCEETGDWMDLTTEDVVLWQLDRSALGRELAAAFRLQYGEEQFDFLPDVRRIGYYVPLAGYSFPAFLAIPSANRNFPQVVSWLVFMHNGPMLLLVPTCRFLSSWQDGFLRRHQVCLMPLEHAVELDDRGRLVLTPGAKQTLDEFRRAVVPEDQPTAAGGAFFPTPPGARWADARIRLVDGHTASVVVGGARGVFNYAEMGLANRKSGTPSVQWQLLRAFAAGHGVLTWRSPHADRRNQKRREVLGRQLREFFRIEGSPFIVLKDGWQSRFAISDGG